MAINSIDVSNVLVFQRQWRKGSDDVQTNPEKRDDYFDGAFHLDFCDGINVIIGENGVGKTSLLKMIYAATQWSNQQNEPERKQKLLHFFSDHLKDTDALKNSEHKEYYCGFKVYSGEHKFEYSLFHHNTVDSSSWYNLNIASVYIPTTEMLSHAKGFLAMNQKYSMPFDGTQVDIIMNASLPETNEVTSTMSEILQILEKVIHGKVVQENDVFYIVKADGRKVDFSLEAEGFRKFGLLWKLVRNGLLEPGSIMLWDEPEANLNPELYPILAEVLLKLQNNGVQVFLATHSYNFAKYLEIRRKDPKSVMFHNLYLGASDKESVSDNKNHVYSSSAIKMEELPHNHITKADEMLLDEVYSFRGAL